MLLIIISNTMLLIIYKLISYSHKILTLSPNSALIQCYYRQFRGNTGGQVIFNRSWCINPTFYCNLVIDYCSSSPCQNNGTCTNSPEGFKCSCLKGFTGIACETGKYLTECDCILPKTAKPAPKLFTKKYNTYIWFPGLYPCKTLHSPHPIIYV